MGDGEDITILLLNVQVEGTFLSSDENGGEEVFVEIIHNSFEVLAASFLALSINLIGFWDNFTRFACDIAFDEERVKNASYAQNGY